MKNIILLIFALTLQFAQPTPADASNLLGNFCNQHLTGLVKPLTLYQNGIFPSDLAELSNPEYVMREGSRVRKILQNMSAEERSRQPVEFYRLQIPFILELLSEVPAANMDRKFRFVSPDRSVASPKLSFAEAISKLKSTGQQMFTENGATPSVFLDWLVDVLYLTEFSRRKVWTDLNIKDISADKSHLIRLVKAGVLPWPSFATLKIEHFSEWEAGLAPLGLAFKPVAEFDGGQSTRLQFFVHDITHAINMLADFHESQSAYVSGFNFFRHRVISSLSKLDRNSQELFTTFWFGWTHEEFGVYEYVEAVESPDQKFGSGISYNRSRPLHNTVERFVVEGDGPDFLRRMSKSKRNQLLIEAEVQFWQILNSNLSDDI